MKNSNPLLDKVAQKIEQSQNNSPTAAGPHKHELSAAEKEQLIDAINQSFELMRINYHHLYFSAYNEMDALNSAKRLWMDSLTSFSPSTILHAVHQIIKESDYLPTISRIIRLCVEIGQNHTLPDVHNAYIEACTTPSPKISASWSHPVVYYAGQKSNWFFLANTSEKIAFPVFKKHYEMICQKILNGEELPEISSTALPEKPADALSKEENKKRMEKMRKNLGI